MPIILHHHERYAGHGYPYGLRANEIPLGARIVAIADAYDAMINDRPYKRAMTHDQAIAELRRHAGTQFDPELVNLFCDLYAAHAPQPDPAVLAMTTARTRRGAALVLPGGGAADRRRPARAKGGAADAPSAPNASTGSFMRATTPASDTQAMAADATASVEMRRTDARRPTDSIAPGPEPDGGSRARTEPPRADAPGSRRASKPSAACASRRGDAAVQARIRAPMRARALASGLPAGRSPAPPTAVRHSLEPRPPRVRPRRGRRNAAADARRRRRVVTGATGRPGRSTGP